MKFSRNTLLINGLAIFLALVVLIQPAMAKDNDLTGDIYRDGIVDFHDLQVFAQQWLGPVGSRADLTGNDGVNFTDFMILRNNWMETGYAPLLISEFMASNNGTLADPDLPGVYPDWIEIYNPTQLDLSLNGWYLTDDDDDLTKWMLPDITLDSGEFLLVFADGFDKRDPANWLHTNFKLSKEDGYLALVGDDGKTVIHEYDYPLQMTDFSFGLSQYYSRPIVDGSDISYYVPTANDAGLGESWTEQSFDDSSWEDGITSLGFGDAPPDMLGHWKFNEATGIIASDSAKGNNATLYNGVKWDVGPTGFGTSVRFDGTNDYIMIDDDPTLSPSDEITFAFWANCVWPSTENPHLIYKGVDDSQYNIQVDRSSFVFEIKGFARISASLPPSGEWVHIACVYNGTRMELYYNGIRQRYVTLSRTLPATSDPIFIGAQAADSSASDHYDGMMDDLRIYNRGLTEQNILDIMSEANIGIDYGTNIKDYMFDVNSSLWTRQAFDMEYPVSVYKTMTLKIKYDDGFVAYLNGVKVATRNAPTNPAWNSQANSDYDDGEAEVYELIDISEYIGVLEQTGNVLAIHAMNDAVDNLKFILLPELIVSSENILYNHNDNYFTDPTPEQPNSTGYVELTEQPTFSKPGGLFVNPFELVISKESPYGVIRYTTDGSIPTESSPVYLSSITVSSNMEVTARVFDDMKAPGPVMQAGFIRVDSTVSNFNTNLPIVVIDTNGVNPNTYSYIRVSSVFIDTPEGGRATGTLAPDYAGAGGMKIRGSSTSGFPKSPYAFETWDEDNMDKNVSIFGFPSESDWVLYSPYEFDRALIRNAFIFELSNQIGRYAPRTRFVEVFVNKYGGTVTYDDYVGVYVFMEKLVRDNDRVDIEKLEPYHNAQPELTGGYLLKIDRADPGDSGFWTNIGYSEYGYERICFVDPKENEISDTQEAYIKDYLNNFEVALYGTNFTDPVSGYAAWIDVDSFIDHNMLDMLAMNVDGLRLSCYMYKDRGEKLKMGPIWDFDRSMGSYDGRDDNPETWYGGGDSTRYFDYYWWGRLFDDPEFYQRYFDRWCELRQTKFSTANINSIIDNMASELSEAQVRNFDKWTDKPPQGGVYQNEINNMKNWLNSRFNWIDSHFPMPIFSVPGQIVTPGFELGITAANGTVYYTTDGSDPRLSGGGVNPNATPMTSSSMDITLVAEDADKRVLVPTSEQDENWRGGGNFNDNQWGLCSGLPGGIVYERDAGAPYLDYSSYDVRDEMYNVADRTSCYIRIPFTVDTTLANISALTLQMRYDDGFIAYLNGVEVYRQYFDAWRTPHYNSASDGSHNDSGFEDFDISSYISELQEGDNILAIHGLNIGTTSSDFIMLPKLVATVLSNGSNSVTINETTRITARTLYNGNWSGPVVQGYAVEDITDKLRVTEIMYHPQDTPEGNPLAEFIEVQNISDAAINLQWAGFTKGVDFTFPAMSLDPGAFTVVIADYSAFNQQYPDFQGRIAGTFTGSLDNGGERIRLSDATGADILNFEYKDGWQGVTDGKGYTLTIIDPLNPDPCSWEEKESWTASTFRLGSPGGVDDVIPDNAIVINEVLAHSHSTAPDWIELYNTTADLDINIGGWYLSDKNGSDAELKAYRIPDDTWLDAGEYKVFYEDVHFGVPTSDPCSAPFALSENGDDVYLSSAINGTLTGYRVDVDFGASATGVAFGLYEGTDDTHFVSMENPTPGYLNAPPKVGPIVISEIMYNPLSDNQDEEYIELTNVGAESVKLYDDLVSEPWQMTDGFDFVFPADTPLIMAPGDVVIIARNPDVFNSTYTVPNGVVVLGPFANDTGLSNGGEKVEISMPGDINSNGVRQYIRVDMVNYNDKAPWPTSPDGDNGDGSSLTRIVVDDFGNDPVNWQGSNPSPGEL